MLLEIIHETTYQYDPNVEIAQHLTHLKPANTETQDLIQSDLWIDPRPAWQDERNDVYGNTCTYFSLETRHRLLTITAKSKIQTKKSESIHLGSRKTPYWELVREYFRYHSGTRWDSASEFLFASEYIIPRPEFAEFARANFTANRPILEAAIDLMQRIYSEFHYVSKSTDINTPAIEALKNREGVCQDFAHILITTMRSIGLPAKYISGYILTNPPPGQARLIGGDASHAWASVYIPSVDDQGNLGPGAWCDLDPTNNRWGFDSPGEDYVHLAYGRDYGDVSPIRGVIHGGADHVLDVAVTVMPIDQ